MSSRQRHTNVNSTSWRWVGVDAKLHKRHRPTWLSLYLWNIVDRVNNNYFLLHSKRMGTPVLNRFSPTEAKNNCGEVFYSILTPQGCYFPFWNMQKDLNETKHCFCCEWVTENEMWRFFYNVYLTFWKLINLLPNYVHIDFYWMARVCTKSPNEDTDQSALSRSLIRVFAGR